MHAMRCSICLECGHNKKSCHKYILPFFPFDSYIKNNVSFNKMSEISIDDIELFYKTSERNTSDEYNKKREAILCQLANKSISNDWIVNNEKWNHLNQQLELLLDRLNPGNSTHYKFNTKGGRSKNYDFELIFFNGENKIKVYKLEFKYGVNEICECPQFVSPMKPSQYFDKSYEELFYDKYLPKLCEKLFLPIPDRDVYLKGIHSNKPEFMRDLQSKYYRGSKTSSKYTGLDEDIENYNYAKQLNNQSIQEFVKTANLNVERINEYLLNSQKDKLYLLWNGSFNLREKDLNDYQISSEPLTIKNNNCICGKTLSGHYIKLLLRWKNGVAYPGLQIS